jgi:hypothetical protein
MQFWFIKPVFRKKESIVYFWKMVSGFFGCTFYTGIDFKNTKALKHLEKQGFEIFNKQENKIFIKCQQQKV